MSAVHTQSVEEVLTNHRTTSAGLPPAEAAQRLERHGLNELRETISRPAWHMLLAQFREPLILILVAAAIISLFLGDFVESIAILAIVFLFGVLGFIQEYRAEKAMAALRQLSSPVVRVRRQGELIEIPSRHLVPGDIVLLEAGNIVPADLRLIHGVELRLLESALTGESEAVRKETAALSKRSLPLGDRRNLAYMGTVVVHGRGAGVVVATGMQTELGKIADMIQGIESVRTPLQRKLAQVGQHLSLAGLGAALALMAMSLLRGEAFTTTLLTAVSLLVAVIPEGLPAVITATLALGGRRMLKRHALIRKLPAVETLGAVTVICSDKTGTLTENRMTVTHLQTRHHAVSMRGTTTAPAEETQSETAPLLLLAALCNDAHLTFEKAGEPPSLIGDPTETALLLAAEHAGIPCQSLAQELPRIREFAFDSDRKRMTTLHASSASDTPLPPCLHAPVVAAVKGSPDDLLAHATHVLDHGRIVPLQDHDRQHFITVNARLAEAGIRVLGVAFRCIDAPPPPTATAADIETQLVFCGLAGLLDPPRDEVRHAIARSHAAG
ncbi:MAG: HAD-IC family P-type ATPase, partial [Kiritimatiellae bacterium]|nr:HAD-IC family P-type ATPase [Kiritimatiellia bacterium]